MRKAASIASIILGVLMVIGGVATWVVVSSTLSDQNIVTSDDACLPGRTVSDPFTAYCQAKVIEKHTLETTRGALLRGIGPGGPAARSGDELGLPPVIAVHFDPGIRCRRDGRRHGSDLHTDRARHPRCGPSNPGGAASGLIDWLDATHERKDVPRGRSTAAAGTSSCDTPVRVARRRSRSSGSSDWVLHALRVGAISDLALV